MRNILVLRFGPFGKRLAMMLIVRLMKGNQAFVKVVERKGISLTVLALE